MDLIRKYFPEITDSQLLLFENLKEKLIEWNEKINLVSRKDIENLEINHILHSLSIGKFIDFTPNSEIMDLGTGGGLPGIPLAILFPNSNFLLIDRIGKKVRAAENIAKSLGLTNVRVRQGDVKENKDKFDFIIARGVMPQNSMWELVKNHLKKINLNNFPNGLISLKGGNLNEELKGISGNTVIKEIKDYFEEPFFETKKIVFTN